MEKIGKESMKGVSGGGVEIRKDDNGELVYLLFDGYTHPDEIIKVQDYGDATKWWYDNEGKIMREFVASNGVTGIITKDKDVCRSYFEWFN